MPSGARKEIVWYKMTDRRFGAFKHGDGTLFGVSDTEDAFAYGLLVDWNDNGIFDGTNEANRMTGYTVDRGRRSYIRPNGIGFENIKAGKMTVTLDNHDGRYDGWNIDSPLYPNVTYGHDVQFTIRDMSQSGAVKEDVFYGQIYNISTSGYGVNAKVTLYIEDGLRYLQNYSARVATTSDASPEDSVGAILDYVNWPTRWGRSLDSTSDNIKFFWASGNKKALSVINDLINSFVGFFFFCQVA